MKDDRKRAEKIYLKCRDNQDSFILEITKALLAERKRVLESEEMKEIVEIGDDYHWLICPDFKEVGDDRAEHAGECKWTKALAAFERMRKGVE